MAGRPIGLLSARLFWYRFHNGTTTNAGFGPLARGPMQCQGEAVRLEHVYRLCFASSMVSIEFLEFIDWQQQKAQMAPLNPPKLLRFVAVC